MALESAMLSNIYQQTAECVWTDYRRLRTVLSLLNQWAVVALPLACILATAGCTTPVNMEPVSFSAPPAVERIAELSLPPDERAALLRAAAAALERNPDPLVVVHTEGTLPTLPAYKRAAQARRDWRSISVLATAYAMDREPRHLDGYARYLKAWLDIYRISGNPIDESNVTGLPFYFQTRRRIRLHNTPCRSPRASEFGYVPVRARISGTSCLGLPSSSSPKSQTLHLQLRKLRIEKTLRALCPPNRLPI